MFTFDLQPHEQLVKVYRRAESSLIKPALIVMLSIYLPIWFLLKYELLAKFIWFLAVWTLLVLSYGLMKYLSWLLNAYILTNKRIISIEYKLPFGKRNTEVIISRIENITVTVPGLWSRLARTGSLIILGAGQQTRMELLNISEPAKVKQEIWGVQSGGVHGI